LAPNHVRPEWPDGAPQQVHLDLHVEDPRTAHETATGSGPDCSRPATWTPPRGTKSMPTRRATPSVSAGGIRLEKPWLPSLLSD
jgi:hypothetical protein